MIEYGVRKYFYVILAAALFLRLLFLLEIPPGIANDEMNLIMNAQSILSTGKNIPGVVTGIVGSTSGDLSMGIHSEIGSFLLIPFIKVFGFNAVSVKLPFVIASIGIVIVGFYLTRKIFNEKVALIAMAILAVNPWLIFFGRTAYESILSSFFYMLSLLLILNLKSWRKLFALFFLIFGFLSYFSAKTLIIPVVLVGTLMSILLNKSKDIKPLVVLNVSVLLFVAVYSFVLPKTPAGARIGELSLNQTVQKVNLKRTMSLDFFLSPLFENKVTEELRVRLAASLGEFNPDYLFLNGQPESIPSLSIPDHGFMYLIDFVLVTLGLLFMAKDFPKQLIVFIGLLAITLFPNFLNMQGTTYSIRTVFLFPILAIVSGVGIYSIKKNYIKYAVLIIYLVSFLNFCSIYFNRLPIERSEGWFLSQRVVSRYIFEATKLNPDEKIILITENPKLTFYKYLFYTANYVNPKEIALTNENIANKNYIFGNLLVTKDCISKNEGLIIQSSSSTCPEIAGKANIKSINDAGDVYIISSDAVCNSLSRNKYPLIKDVGELNIEKLSVENFCKNYISDSL